VVDDYVKQIISTQANKVAKVHHGYVEREDLQQEAWVYVLERPDLLEEDTKSARKVLTKSIYFELNRYAMRQRYLKDGTHPEDYFRYTKGIVQELLPEVLDGHRSVSGAALDDSRVKRSPSEGFNREAMGADIQREFDRLAESDRIVLIERYCGGGISEEVLALTYDVTPDTMRKRVGRALNRLSKRLNGEVTEHQGRRAISNAHAQVVTRREAEGR